MTAERFQELKNLYSMIYLQTLLKDTNLHTVKASLFLANKRAVGGDPKNCFSKRVSKEPLFQESQRLDINIYIYQNAFELKLKTVYFHGLKKKTQELNQKFLRMEKQ